MPLSLALVVKTTSVCGAIPSGKVLSVKGGTITQVPRNLFSLVSGSMAYIVQIQGNSPGLASPLLRPSLSLKLRSPQVMPELCFGVSS